MQNHIAPDDSAWPNASRQACFPSRVAPGDARPASVHDDQPDSSAGTTPTAPGGIAVPASDFEGFGSFS